MERSYTYDALGRLSSMVYSDSKDGDVRESYNYEYDKSGKITEQAGEGIDNEVGYTGQIFDESTGLYYYNARFYDPEAGSFTTQDTYRGDGTEVKYHKRPQAGRKNIEFNYAQGLE